jgi:hypothetical protein
MNKKQEIFEEIKEILKNKNNNLNTIEIKRFIDKFYNSAISNYLSLPKPRFCSSKNYILIWINQEIIKDITTKNIIDIKNKTPPNDLKNTIKFYQNKQYHSLSPQTPKKIINSATKDFIEIIKERNFFAQNRGYKSYLEMRLNNECIPIIEYKEFLRNIDSFILKSKNYLNKPIILNSELSNTCFICQSKPLPYKNVENFINIFSQKYPLYEKNKNKIKINLTNYSSSEYIKENDTFRININKNIKLNHQILDFIHEISHIDLMIKTFKKNYLQNLVTIP